MTSLKILFLAVCLMSSLAAQQAEWCKKLPRPAYSSLERVPTADLVTLTAIYRKVLERYFA